MDTNINLKIRGEDSLFSKETIRAALGRDPEEQVDPELGNLYHVLSTPTVSVTTHFSAFGWYHVTHVEEDEQPDEDRFWDRLQNWS